MSNTDREKKSEQLEQALLSSSETTATTACSDVVSLLSESNLLQDIY